MIKPIIILVETQMARNIGTVARAMLNFGLTDLRLVRPTAKHLSQDAHALAAGADQILENCQIFKTTKEAVADLHYIYATTARHRDMLGLHMAPRQAAEIMTQHSRDQARFGLLFGPEKSGLINEDVAICTGTISVPVNPDFSSLNLAQAVLLLAYEFHQISVTLPPIYLKQGKSELATKEELIYLFAHLEAELEQRGYFRVAHKKPKMMQSIRTMFSRIPFTSQEIRTFRGVISSLVKPIRSKP